MSLETAATAKNHMRFFFSAIFNLLREDIKSEEIQHCEYTTPQTLDSVQYLPIRIEFLEEQPAKATRNLLVFLSYVVKVELGPGSDTY